MIGFLSYFMSVANLRSKISRFTVPAIATLLVISLLYSVLIRANIILWFQMWGRLLGIGTGLFVVYLFYRLVLAVEQIANNQ